MSDRAIPAWMTVLACVALAPLPAAGQNVAAATDPLSTAPLALTPAEYNNTIADLLGFPRDGERRPARPALADTLSPRRVASKGVFVPPPPPRCGPGDSLPSPAPTASSSTVPAHSAR